MRVALYARVSTDSQDLTNQVEELKKFAANRGYDVFGVFEDVASGSRDSRPALDSLMKCAFKKDFDAVIVWKLDRLGRSLQHLVSVVNQWSKAGIDLVVVTQQIDTTTSGGRLIFNIFASIAEFERELISERTKLGLRGAKNVGKRGKDKSPRKRGGYFFRHNPHLRVKS